MYVQHLTTRTGMTPLRRDACFKSQIPCFAILVDTAEFRMPRTPSGIETRTWTLGTRCAIGARFPPSDIIIRNIG